MVRGSPSCAQGGSDADEIHGWNTYTYWDGPTSTGMWPIIRFDLSTLTTADTVTAASMSFYVNNPGNDAEVYKLLCGPINEDTTTWNNVNGGAPFDEAACLGPTKVADACGASDPTSSTACVDETPYSFDVTTAVQEWIASPATNYGFIFKPSGGNNGVGIWTSDRIGGADAPALTLTVAATSISPPPPCTTSPPPPSPSPPTPAPVTMATLTLSGAQYVQDSHIKSYSSLNYASEGAVLWDGQLSDGDWALLKVDMPPAVIAALSQGIESAALRYKVDNSGDPAQLHEAAVPWFAVNVTWLNINNGAAYSPSVLGAHVGTASGASGWQTVDVTSSVSNWLTDPSSNYGWIFHPNGGSNGVTFISTEAAVDGAFAHGLHRVSLSGPPVPERTPTHGL